MASNGIPTIHSKTQQPESDWDYNARKKKEQEEVDRILIKLEKVATTA